MNKRLEQIMNGQEGSYVLPFFWPYEGHPELAEPQIEAIHACGIREICVEARPFEDYAGPGWWEQMDRVLAAAKKRDMRVWILDDKHFPTGYANGLLEREHPEHCRHYLREHHVDLMGPATDTSVLVPPANDRESLLCIVAFRRTENLEEITGQPIVLQKDENSDFAFFDLPDGCWRVFMLYDTPYGSPADHRWFIDMLSRESVQLLIDAVYEKHYAKYADEFGKTIAGFFSDEPSFGCEHLGPFGSDVPFYYRTIGQAGTALPWRENVAERMRADGIDDPVAMIPTLWYPYADDPAEVRLSYMNALTRIWNENFSYALGDWCRAHGVRYIGHIIEDMNAHSRIGGSAGHYFRALSGQDMAGIDIVLHQTVPGFGQYPTSSPIAGGVADPKFFHYILAHLASSLARIEPHMHGDAMCEVFGAYGWAAGTPLMKWIIDHLLVRGINHFVPHAFSTQYPYEDCPPHFYADGNNPQYDGFGALMRYTNKAAHLLCGTERTASGAIFYYAENEWMSDGDFAYCDDAAKLLYDAHIDYDILPLDALKTAECRDGKLTVNGHEHTFLIVPEAKHYPTELLMLSERFAAAGLPVFTLESAPCRYPQAVGQRTSGTQLLQTIREKRLAHDYGTFEPFVRIAEFKDGDDRFYMLMNEAPHAVENAAVSLPVTGDCLRLRLHNDEIVRLHTQDGTVRVSLQPGESAIFCFGAFDAAQFAAPAEVTETRPLDLKWDIALRQTGMEKVFTPYRRESGLFNITGKNGLPDFSGEMRYTATFTMEKAGRYVLDLGKVGHTARLSVNGQDLGMRISAPYAWDISSAVKAGENTVEIIAANTLVNRIHDRFSIYLQLLPGGVTGPVTLKSLKTK